MIPQEPESTTYRCNLSIGPVAAPPTLWESSGFVLATAFGEGIFFPLEFEK
jgi:hypothetical protein